MSVTNFACLKRNIFAGAACWPMVKNCARTFPLARVVSRARSNSEDSAIGNLPGERLAQWINMPPRPGVRVARLPTGKVLSSPVEMKPEQDTDGCGRERASG